MCDVLIPCAVCEEEYDIEEMNDVDAYCVCDYCIDEVGCLCENCSC